MTNTNMSMLSTPHQNRNICDEIEIKVEGRKKTMHSKKCLPRSDVDDGLIDQRLVELQELLGTYYYGIPMSCLSWLERGYRQKFNRSLDYKSLGVNNIKELIEKMRDKGMVLLFEEPESKKEHVMSARMVKIRQNVFLKLDVKELLDRYCGEIEFSSFEDLYEDQFKVNLNYFLYGLTNLDHLCNVLKDILVVEEATPSGAKVIKAVTCYNLRKRKNTNMSALSSPQQNQNICDEIEIKVEGRKKTMHSKKCLPRSDVGDGLIDQRLVELQELLGTYYYGISMSCLSWLERDYRQKFNRSLDFKSLGVNNIKELLVKMGDKGLVVEEENPAGGKLIKAVKCYNLRKRKTTNMSTLSSPQQNRNICDEIEIKVQGRKKTMHSKKCLPRSDVDDGLIDQRLVLQELLETYYCGIQMSCLSWLERDYLQKFNKSLDYKSLGVNNIKELVEKMRDKGMVVVFEEQESKKEYVMSARMVEIRQNVYLKLNVQKLLDRYSGVIKFISFEDLYEDQFKVKLNYFQYGLTNLDHLCNVLKDILVVEEANPSGVKLIKAVKNATIQGKGRNE